MAHFSFHLREVIFTETPLCTTQYLVTLDASCPQEMRDRKRPVLRQYTQQVKEQLRTFKEVTSAVLGRRNKQVGRKKTICFNASRVLVFSKCSPSFLLRDRVHSLRRLFLRCTFLLSSTTQVLQPVRCWSQNTSAQSCPDDPVHSGVLETAAVMNGTFRTSRRDIAGSPPAPVRARETTNQRQRDGDSNFLFCCRQEKVHVI